MKTLLLSSDIALLALTVGLFCLGTALYRRTRLIVLHPVLVTFLTMIAVLRIAGIGYESYRASTSVLDFGLGLSVVALGYLLYEQAELLRRHLWPLLVAVAAGSLTGILSVAGIGRLFGLDHTMITTLAPKSTTAPIAVAIAEPLGSIASITLVMVFCTGILGALCGEWLLRRCGVSDSQARGLALGAASHGIGTARAIEIGAVEGAMSGLAMALMGVFTAFLLPLIEKFGY